VRGGKLTAGFSDARLYGEADHGGGEQGQTGSTTGVGGGLNRIVRPPLRVISISAQKSRTDGSWERAKFLER
jgi:hypothetical protein